MRFAMTAAVLACAAAPATGQPPVEPKDGKPIEFVRYKKGLQTRVHLNCVIAISALIVPLGNGSRGEVHTNITAQPEYLARGGDLGHAGADQSDADQTDHRESRSLLPSTPRPPRSGHDATQSAEGARPAKQLSRS